MDTSFFNTLRLSLKVTESARLDQDMLRASTGFFLHDLVPSVSKKEVTVTVL